MKTSIISSIVLAATFAMSSVSHASEAHANLRLLQIVVGEAVAGAQELQTKVQETAKDYKSLRFFRMKEKVRLSRENCADIEVSHMSNVASLTAVFQVVGSGNDYETPEFVQKMSKLVDYFKVAKLSKEKCSVPSESLKYVAQEAALLTEVNEYLVSIVK